MDVTDVSEIALQQPYLVVSNVCECEVKGEEDRRERQGDFIKGIEVKRNIINGKVIIKLWKISVLLMLLTRTLTNCITKYASAMTIMR